MAMPKGHGMDANQNANFTTIGAHDSGRGFKPIAKDGGSIGGTGSDANIPNQTKGPATPSHGGTVSPGPTNWEKGGMAPAGVQEIPNNNK